MTIVRKRHRGFTLIELMITVAVVAILSAVAYPSYLSQINKGRRVECRGGIMQSMQQQERYFTQYNTYVAFPAGAASAATKSFSGENLNASACRLQAIECTAPSNTALGRCVELRALPVRADSAFNYLYVDSEGNKGCEVAGTGRTTGNKTCWP